MNMVRRMNHFMRTTDGGRGEKVKQTGDVQALRQREPSPKCLQPSTGWSDAEVVKMKLCFITST